VSLLNELLLNKSIEAQIETLTLILSSGGRFEVTVNDDLVYSKLATGRHAKPGEVSPLVKAKI
jgi:selenoprotein W-related protein